jgi:hypothetical protein
MFDPKLVVFAELRDRERNLPAVWHLQDRVVHFNPKQSSLGIATLIICPDSLDLAAKAGDAADGENQNDRKFHEESDAVLHRRFDKSTQEDNRAAGKSGADVMISPFAGNP